MMPALTWIWVLVTTGSRNLLRSPRRTIINVATIACATCSILVFESFVEAVTQSTRKNIITAHYAHFEITKKGYDGIKSENPFGFQIDSFSKLRADLDQVAKLSLFSKRQNFFAILYHGEKSFSGVGLGVSAKEDQEFFTLARVVEGSHLGDSPKDGLFIGVDQAEYLGAKVGDLITAMVSTADGSINASDFVIAGIFRSGVKEIDERTFYIHHEASEELVQATGTPRIMVGFDVEDERPLIEPVKAMIESKYPELQITHWQEQAQFFDNLMGWMSRQVFVFYAIVLFIVAISILNVFSMGLLERLGEYGTLRAIGTQRSEIVAMIFGESLVQAATGGLTGLIIGSALIAGPLSTGIEMPPPPLMSTPMVLDFKIPWESFPVTFLVCTGVAGIAGIFPAIKMARSNIVMALARNI